MSMLAQTATARETKRVTKRCSEVRRTQTTCAERSCGGNGPDGDVNVCKHYGKQYGRS